MQELKDILILIAFTAECAGALYIVLKYGAKHL